MGLRPECLILDHTAGASPNHLHQCDLCGMQWGHSEKSLDCDLCHTCPGCGNHSSETGLVYAFTSLEEEVKFLKAKVTNIVRKTRSYDNADIYSRIEVLVCAERLADIRKLQAQATQKESNE